MMTEKITALERALSASMDYREYRHTLDALLTENRTTGPRQTEELVHFTRLNVKRMDRLEKTVAPMVSTLKALGDQQRPLTWLVLTEGWCGDAAQNLPILAKLADASAKIEMRLVLRDEHLDLMDHFLTHAGRSIPKLLAIDPDRRCLLGEWGPRPAPAQQMMMDWKAKQDRPKADVGLDIQRWYNADKGQTLQGEILELLQQWSHIPCEDVA